MQIARVILIVMDSVGVGALPDADRYGDQGSNTLANTARAVRGLYLPNFQRLGLGNIIEIKGTPSVPQPLASYGKMAEVSAGKDTTIGHWEIMGLHISRPFPTYPNGFPPEIILAFEKAIGRRILGNKPASGTEIIKELGDEHVKTGHPIVYTSADSVFQIAAHEEVIPLEKLYEMCKVARRILVGPHQVDRIIARPFIGRSGNFTRTPHRRDFGVPPPSKTVLDYAQENGIKVYAIGKIGDIFSMRGIAESVDTVSNVDGIDKTLEFMKRIERGIIFADLTDFDTLWGHRNNTEGYAKGLREVDNRIPEMIALTGEDDVLIFTADHGCDPTTASTDHSREYVPLLIYGGSLKGGVNLGIRKSFSDLGKTISDLLGFKATVEGTSFASKITI